MTYKRQEIGNPTLGIIQEFITSARLRVPASEVYGHYKSRGWLTKKGQPIKTLESMVLSYNSIFVQRERKESGVCINKPKSEVTIKDFESIMERVRTEAPKEWLRLYEEAVEIVNNRPEKTCQL